MQQANQVAVGAAPAAAASASPASTGATGSATAKATVNGGRFDFDDGGTFCGGWEDGKAHGHGVCTGPKGQGAYAGSWHFGFEVSGVYTWPSGSTFEGQWQNGKRHGLGVEARGRWLYRGEWTQGFKGRYGVRQSATSNARYEGTWANGLQDGYGSETYADGGTYQGQWLRGMRHGYGVRASAPFGLASHYRPGSKAVRASMTSLRSSEPGAADAAAAAERDRRLDDSRGGFVLKARSDEPPARRGSLTDKSSKGLRKVISGLKLKHRSASDLDKRGTSASIRSTGSTTSWVSTDSSQSAVTSASVHTDSNASFVVEDEQLDASVTETYMGEWKNDKRAGFGISERSDGLRYEGEWFANKKYGYGVTTLRDGTREEGKYKNNVLITSQKKKHMFLIRSAKFRERIDAAVNAAQRASKIALQKADIAISRTATARGKAELADMAAEHAREDSDIARETARQFAPDFQQPGLDRPRYVPKYKPPPEDAMPTKSILHQPSSTAQQPPKHNETTFAVPGPPPSAQQAQQQYANYNQVPSSQQQQQQQQHNPPAQQNYAQPSQQNYPYSQQPMQQLQQQLQQQHQLQLQQQQQQQLSDMADGKPMANKVGGAAPYDEAGGGGGGGGALQRGAPSVKSGAAGEAALGLQQSLTDRFDHYKRPPSRDSSVDRYARATASARLSMAPSSRQPSVDKAPAREPSVDRAVRAGSTARGTTPAPAAPAPPASAALPPPVNGAVPSPNAIPPFEDVILRKRGLGQDIIPSPGQPKRTESLYINRQPPVKSLPVPQPLQRKKSLPDVQGLPRATEPMSREEVSVLSSARREEVRRVQLENERLRANPLLYLVSPHVKEWFSRQQLVMLVLFINISLAIMFFKLLT